MTMPALSLVLSYILGAVPTGYIVAKLVKKIDIRQYGSGNIGMSNVLRTVGTGPAIVVLLVDALKGLLPVYLLRTLMPDQPLWWLAAGLLAIGGHNWSPFLGFRGGRGVATSGGVLAALAPDVVGMLVLTWALILLLTRYISAASLAVAALLPILLFIRSYPPTYFVVGLLMGLFTIYRHIPNIQRLIAGTEYKFGTKGRKI